MSRVQNRAVIAGNIPPEAAIDAPDWYAPLTGSSVDVTGLAHARFATNGQFHWKLMWGVGEAPSSWTTVHEGDSNGTVNDFGSIDLNAVRTALETFVVPPDSGGPTFAASEPNPYQHEFTVQLEVNGVGIPMTGIDVTIEGARAAAEPNRFAVATMTFEIAGVSQGQADELVATYRGR